MGAIVTAASSLVASTAPDSRQRRAQSVATRCISATGSASRRASALPARYQWEVEGWYPPPSACRSRFACPCFLFFVAIQVAWRSPNRVAIAAFNITLFTRSYSLTAPLARRQYSSCGLQVRPRVFGALHVREESRDHRRSSPKRHRLQVSGKLLFLFLGCSRCSVHSLP